MEDDQEDVSDGLVFGSLVCRVIGKYNMNTLYRKAVLRMGAVAVASLFAWEANAIVADFQDGADGYAGTQDATLLNGVSANQNFGSLGDQDTIYAGAFNSTTRRTLLRFDLSSFAGAYTSITSVTLRLTQYTANNGVANPGTATVYSVSAANAGWIEGSQWGAIAAPGECCWNYRNYNTNAWAGGDGLATADTDYTNTWGTFSYVTGQADGAQVIDINFTGTSTQLTTLISSWTNRDTNAGLFLREIDGADYSVNRFIGLAAHQNSHVSWRPHLFVGYVSVSAPVVADFQDGAAGYAGTQDATLLNGVSANHNFGSLGDQDVIYLGAFNSDTRRALLRFDLSSFAGLFSSVSSVKLRLTQYTASYGVPNPGTATVCSVSAANAGWIEGIQWGATAAPGECCWNYCNYSTNAWAGGAGLATAGIDYTRTLATFSYVAGQADGYQIDIDFDGSPAQLTALVSSWTTSGNNAGLFLREINGADYSVNRFIGFAAHQYSQASWRPHLFIGYTPFPIPKGTVFSAR